VRLGDVAKIKVKAEAIGNLAVHLGSIIARRREGVKYQKTSRKEEPHAKIAKDAKDAKKKAYSSFALLAIFA